MRVAVAVKLSEEPGLAVYSVSQGVNLSMRCQTGISKSLGFTPRACGQFVDRINSTRGIANGREWEGIVKCSKIFGGCNLRKGKDLCFCRDYGS